MHLARRQPQDLPRPRRPLDIFGNFFLLRGRFSSLHSRRLLHVARDEGPRPGADPTLFF